MEVGSTNSKIQKDLTIDLKEKELRKKLEEKFGKSFEVKKIQPRDKVELSKKASKAAHIDPEGFGDIKKNDPHSEETKAKLKGLLASGGFKFSEKERKALGDILG